MGTVRSTVVVRGAILEMLDSSVKWDPILSLAAFQRDPKLSRARVPAREIGTK